MELEALLKEKQDLITSFAGSSTNLPQSFISSSRATPHSLSIAVSVPASKSFGSFGAGGYADPSILNDSSSVAGMLEGFIEGIPAELGNRLNFYT